MPSQPWGSSSTMAVMRPHLASALLIYWSMTSWAPLAKSPNCASHMISRRGSAELMPYSKPSTASSDSMLLYTSNSH